jgi:uncharacterized protein (UPF0147 family)
MNEVNHNAFTSILETLEELTGDDTIPRNVKAKLGDILSRLKTDEDMSIKINKALNELDEISSDTNLQAYTRTQIWNIASLLESL